MSSRMSPSSWVPQCDCEAVNVTTRMFDGGLFTNRNFTSGRLLHDDRPKAELELQSIKSEGWQLNKGLK